MSRLHESQRGSELPEAGPTLSLVANAIEQGVVSAERDGYIPHEHIEFLKSLRDYWQTETHIFLHANVEPDIAMEQQPIAFLHWNKLNGDEVCHCSGKTVICGHTSLASGVPALCDGFICIDTKAYDGLWLTCLDVDERNCLAVVRSR